MGWFQECDHSDCPAVALHHVDLCGQDFHFCNHHWVELSPAVAAMADPWGTGAPAAHPGGVEPDGGAVTTTMRIAP
jgi:hypothetical protein